MLNSRPVNGENNAPPDRVILAVPGGRILQAFLPFLSLIGIRPHPDFGSANSRRLIFPTSDPKLILIQVRAFDVATFVAFGAAHLGIAGNDIITEFEYSEIYAPLDLGIGVCRLVLAAPETCDPLRWSAFQVATKYPRTTTRYFAQRGIRAECIPLRGSMEHAPSLGLCPCIVDLVQTGNTLRSNGLIEIETLLSVSSRLIVNRHSFKTQPQRIQPWIQRFQDLL